MHHPLIGREASCDNPDVILRRDEDRVWFYGFGQGSWQRSFPANRLMAARLGFSKVDIEWVFEGQV